MSSTPFVTDNSMPAAKPDFLDGNIAKRLGMPDAAAPKILLLYGSLRERSFSRLAVEEAARLLEFFGAETRIFDPVDYLFPTTLAVTSTRR